MTPTSQWVNDIFRDFTKNRDIIREQQIKSAEDVETKTKSGSKAIISGSIIDAKDEIPECPYFYDNPRAIYGINLLRPYTSGRVIKNPEISKIPYRLGNPIFMR